MPLAAIAAVAAVLAGCSRPPSPARGATQIGPAAESLASIRSGLERLLEGHRAIIVLLAEDAAQSAAERLAADNTGRVIFHENLELGREVDTGIAAQLASRSNDRFAALASLLDYIESSPDLFDADRLAFRERLVQLRDGLTSDGSLPAIRMHQRVGEDLDALRSIESSYDQELRQVFGRFATRAIELKREKWQDYLARLTQRRPRAGQPAEG
jgi:hypothetical protein